jgi:hypothetical protein
VRIKNGSIIEFGPQGARRVGIVIGRFRHPDHGSTLCVRTPENVLKGQPFDNCPVKLMKPTVATLADLQHHAEIARDAALARMTAWVEEVRENA